MPLLARKPPPPPSPQPAQLWPDPQDKRGRRLSIGDRLSMPRFPSGKVTGILVPSPTGRVIEITGSLYRDYAVVTDAGQLFEFKPGIATRIGMHRRLRSV